MKKILKVISAIAATAGFIYLIGEALKEEDIDLTVDTSETMSEDDLYGDSKDETDENTKACDAENMDPYDDIYHQCSYLNIPLKK